MRRSNTQNIGQVIWECLQDLKIDRRLKEIRLVRSWEELLGKTVAKATSKIYVKDQVLYVHLHSSVIRHELFMLKSSILKKLNEKAGDKVIDDIIFR